MSVRIIRNLPVVAEYDTFLRAVQGRVAWWVQSRTRGRGGLPVRREVALTEGNRSLAACYRLFQERRPRPVQAYIRAELHASGVRIERIDFSAEHLRPRTGPPPGVWVLPRGRGDRVRARMRDVVRDLAGWTAANSFAAWYLPRHHELTRPGNNPPMRRATLTGVQSGPRYGVAFDQLSGRYWTELERLHAEAPSLSMEDRQRRIEESGYIQRQRDGLQAAIDWWASAFENDAASDSLGGRIFGGAGEAAFGFRRSDEYRVFWNVMRTSPPLPVPAVMRGRMAPP